MEVNADKLLENALRDGLREGVKSKLSGYNSPLDNLIESSIEKHSDSFRGLLDDAIKSCIDCKVFREDIATSIRSQLAKTLIKRFGGELEKQVNVLKSDPSTRARITLAIEEIVTSHTSQ